MFKSATLRPDFLSGLVISFIALPLCLGISMASNFPPMAGLLTAIIGGLVVSFLSGSQLTIKGPAAGLIVVAVECMSEMKELDATQAYELAIAVVAVSGLVQIFLGLVKFGKAAAFFKDEVVHAMMFAIGLIILAKQAHVLFGVTPESKTPLTLLAEIPRSLMNMNPAIALIGFISILILVLFPKIPIKPFKMIPAHLIVVLVAIPMGIFFDLEHTHKLIFHAKEYDLDPHFLVNVPNQFWTGIAFPNFSKIMTFPSIKFILMFALIGGIEALLTSKAIDGMDPEKRKSNPDKDLISIGVGNFLSGMVGGLPMICEVARSSANVNNGAKTQGSNFFHGLFLLLFLLFLPAVIHEIPLSALAAMLIVVGYRLASPATLKQIFKHGPSACLIFITTVFLTLKVDLLVGVVSGLILELVLSFIQKKTKKVA